MYQEFPDLSRFLSYRIELLRSLRRWLINRGIGYVEFTEDKEDFWRKAGKHIPCFSTSLKIAELEQNLLSTEQLKTIQSLVQPGDKIYPFAMNVDTRAMRLGYVVLRHGKPIGGIIKVRS